MRRRQQFIIGMPLDGDRIGRSVDLGLDPRVDTIAERRGVQIVGVAEVHDILDHQHVVRFSLEMPYNPRGWRNPIDETKIGYEGGIGGILVAQPHPQGIMTGHDWIGGDAQRGNDRTVWIAYAHALPVECKAVVAADRRSVLDLATRQGREPVRAAVEKSGKAAIRLKEKKRNVGDDARQMTVDKLIKPCAQIPYVAQESVAAGHGPS